MTKPQQPPAAKCARPDCPRPQERPWAYCAPCTDRYIRRN